MQYERVYVLELHEGCYYVGSTTREMFRRYQEHLDGAGHGARWTTRHPPRRIVCCE